MGPGTPGPSSHYHSGLFTPPRGKNHFQGPQGPPATITVDYSPLRGGKITSRDPRALYPLSQWTIHPSEGEKSLPGTPGPSSHYHSGLFTPPRGKNHFQAPQGPLAIQGNFVI